MTTIWQQIDQINPSFNTIIIGIINRHQDSKKLIQLLMALTPVWIGSCYLKIHFWHNPLWCIEPLQRAQGIKYRAMPVGTREIYHFACQLALASILATRGYRNLVMASWGRGGYRDFAVASASHGSIPIAFTSRSDLAVASTSHGSLHEVIEATASGGNWEVVEATATCIFFLCFIFCLIFNLEKKYFLFF